VEDSDATLILCVGEPSGGTLLTLNFAREVGRPHRVVDLDANPDPAETEAWIAEAGIATLNVAGPRESGAPGVGARAEAFLRAVFSLT
jgi:hypothetical protein